MGEAGGCIFGSSLQAGWMLGHKNSRQVAGSVWGGRDLPREDILQF